MTKNAVVKTHTLFDQGGNVWTTTPPGGDGGSGNPQTLLALAIAGLSGPGRVGFYVDYSERSSAGFHTFYVCRTHGTTGAVTVEYETIGDAHQAVSGTLAWADGEADIKSFTAEVTAGDLSAHDSAGLGEHRIVARLHTPGGGVVLHRGVYTRAYGVLDNATLIASDANAIFIDFDAVSNGTGTQASPFNNWFDARDQWIDLNVGSSDFRRYIYMMGTAISDGTDLHGATNVFDEEGHGAQAGNLDGNSDTDRLIIRNWPGQTCTVAGGTGNAGFFLESACNYTTFRGISFDGLSTAGTTAQCYAFDYRHAAIAPTFELITVNDLTTGANSDTAAIHMTGSPEGWNIWRCKFTNIVKENGTIMQGIEQYDGGFGSLQRSELDDCTYYQKDSPASPGGVPNTGICIRFCIISSMIRLSGLGTNVNNTYVIIQGNLLRNGTIENPALRYDSGNGGGVGDKQWIVGNVFADCGYGTSSTNPMMRVFNDEHDNFIIFNNIYYQGFGIWRFDPTTRIYEYCNHNHEYSVGLANTYLYNYQGGEYNTTSAMNTAEGFEANHSTGDPLFTDLVNNDVSLGVGSPCLGSGVDGTNNGVFLTGVEALGA